MTLSSFFIMLFFHVKNRLFSIMVTVTISFLPACGAEMYKYLTSLFAFILC